MVVSISGVSLNSRSELENDKKETFSPFNWPFSLDYGLELQDLLRSVPCPDL